MRRPWTVLHVHNGRCGMTYCWGSPYFHIDISSIYQWFNPVITFGRMGRGGHHPTIRGGHHPTSVALFYEKSLHQNGIGSMI